MYLSLSYETSTLVSSFAFLPTKCLLVLTTAVLTAARECILALLE